MLPESILFLTPKQKYRHKAKVSTSQKIRSPESVCTYENINRLFHSIITITYNIQSMNLALSQSVNKAAASLTNLPVW